MEGVWRPSPAAPRELKLARHVGIVRRHCTVIHHGIVRRHCGTGLCHLGPLVPSSRAELAEGGRPSDVNWLTIERGQLSARKLAEETDFLFCQK